MREMLAGKARESGRVFRFCSGHVAEQVARQGETLQQRGQLFVAWLSHTRYFSKTMRCGSIAACECCAVPWFGNFDRPKQN